jgi:hypothetical protein
MRESAKLRRVLDGDKAFMQRHLAEHCFGEVRLSARIGPTDNDCLLSADCRANELMPCACAVESKKLIITGGVLGWACRLEQTPCGQLFQRRPGSGATANGEAGTPLGDAWIQHGLKPSAAHKVGRKQRTGMADVLPALSGRDDGDVLDLVGVQVHVMAGEFAGRIDPAFAWPLDAHLLDSRIVQPVRYRFEKVIERDAHGRYRCVS